MSHVEIYCPWSDLPKTGCACGRPGCQNVEAPEIIEAAGDALDRKGGFE